MTYIVFCDDKLSTYGYLDCFSPSCTYPPRQIYLEPSVDTLVDAKLQLEGKMASVSYIKPKKLWKVNYRLHLPSRPKQKARYVKDKRTADLLCPEAQEIEQATKHRLATLADIQEWVEDHWLTHQEASQVSN